MMYWIAGCIFLSVSALVFYLFTRSFVRPTHERLLHASSTEPLASPAWLLPFSNRMVDLLGKLSPLAADKPKHTATETSPLRIRLLQAGFLSPRAPLIFLGAKVLIAFLFVTLSAITLTFFKPIGSLALLLLMTLISFSVGFYFPDLVLSRLIHRRKRMIFHAFPDVLDLMRMCVQAGLGLDQSLDRVGKEIGLTCPALSKLLEVTGLELRAGVSRADALRNLALRIGLSDVDAFVVTLIQADRFGNSVADALAIYADALRSKRRITSEEMAAKLPVKLMIPLVFCIFPSLLTVLLGPAIVHIHNRLIPALSG
jgi:tight adherence protein C